ncbi:uncharacterized protein LOC123701516 [Colias croceus]|uniref:uncharacterized protein LOC123701516 n=1 Tax=Colias crocea TaxID=72248 RepID=UPI001E27DE1C|nr:uncharacterized protein LOC123701516 [Colias croceus]
MDAVYPAAASALTRGRRRRRNEPRLRHHTMPVTFAEIKEVDEEKDTEEKVTSAASASNVSASVEDRRRRLDMFDDSLGRQFDDSLGRQFAEFRNRRNRRRRDVIREPEEEHTEPSSESHPNPT